jgi:uncharacterized membrane protein
MDKYLLRVIDALVWLIIGMTAMARLYCIKYNITDGADYISWGMSALIVGGVVAMRWVVALDPSFRKD